MASADSEAFSCESLWKLPLLNHVLGTDMGQNGPYRASWNKKASDSCEGGSDLHCLQADILDSNIGTKAPSPCCDTTLDSNTICLYGLLQA